MQGLLRLSVDHAYLRSLDCAGALASLPPASRPTITATSNIGYRPQFKSDHGSPAGAIRLCKGVLMDRSAVRGGREFEVPDDQSVNHSQSPAMYSPRRDDR